MSCPARDPRLVRLYKLKNVDMKRDGPRCKSQTHGDFLKGTPHLVLRRAYSSTPSRSDYFCRQPIQLDAWSSTPLPLVKMISAPAGMRAQQKAASPLMILRWLFTPTKDHLFPPVFHHAANANDQKETILYPNQRSGKILTTKTSPHKPPPPPPPGKRVRRDNALVKDRSCDRCKGSAKTRINPYLDHPSSADLDQLISGVNKVRPTE